MAKVQQISELTQSFAFTEYDFYKNYEESFKESEIGRIHSILPLHEMAVSFGLIDPHPRRKAGRKSYFSPEGKVALMFLRHTPDCQLPNSWNSSTQTSTIRYSAASGLIQGIL